MITKQVLEYLLKSKLVVADSHYHNPNVFYELAIRHTTGRPVIHIKRTCDPIPFDNKDFRTIDIAFDNKFDILAQLERCEAGSLSFHANRLPRGRQQRQSASDPFRRSSIRKSELTVGEVCDR